MYQKLKKHKQLERPGAGVKDKAGNNICTSQENTKRIPIYIIFLIRLISFIEAIINSVNTVNTFMSVSFISEALK